MSDLIDRQAAIDALCGECQGNCIPCEHYPCGEIKALEQLPSVQPEIIRCKECKHYVDGYIHCNRVTWWNGEDDFCSRAERRDGCDDGGGA